MDDFEGMTVEDIYRSNGEISDESSLDELFELWSEPGATPPIAEERSDAVA
jgi:hypothetical protein